MTASHSPPAPSQDALPSRKASVDSSSSSSTKTAASPSSRFFTILSYIKMAASMVLILFSGVVVSAAIFTKQTDATAKLGVPPILALCVFWFSLAWLAIMEGGLNCMVGLQPIDKDIYAKTHPKTYLCTKAAYSSNIEHFIVGRQYLDLTIVFGTSFMVSSISGAQVLGLPPLVNDIFLGNDLGIILLTIVFGQLVSIINSSHNMLDYINNWCMVCSTYLALFVEATGILHAVYFVQIVFTHLATKSNTDKDNNKTTKKNNRYLKKKQSDVMDAKMGDTSSTSSSAATEEGFVDQVEATTAAKPPKPMWQRVLFWVRIVFSLGMSAFAVTVFMTALLQGNTTLRSEIPIPVSIISLIILLLLGGFMEALQIALFAVKHLDQDKIEANPRARRNCQLILSSADNDQENSKLRAFMIGRQIAQTVIMFMIARIVSVDMKVEGETMFGVPPIVQKVLFDSGLLNALVFTIFASLSWRVTANFFPMLYLGSPLSIWIIRLCLLVEATGICDAAWVFSKMLAYVVGFQSDEHYMAVSAAATSSDVDVEAQQKRATKEYHKHSSIATESLHSASSGEGSSHAAAVVLDKEEDEC